MHVDPKGTVGHVIEQYLDLPVEEVEVVPDPVVAGAYAIRARARTSSLDTRTFEFLVTNVALHRLDVGDLEEVEFMSWPPESNL